MKPDIIIPAFDAYLAERKVSFECIAVGAAVLGLLGIITRHTRDLDVLDPELPEDILDLAHRFAEQCRDESIALADDWLNNGPISLIRDLPGGWQDRLQTAFAGKALTIHSLGRLDLLRSKLFALCDRGIDVPDCLALAPSVQEIAEVTPWLELRDTNPDWPEHVREVLKDLGERLGHGV